MPSSFGRLMLGLAVLGTGSVAQAYFLDSTRNFDVRLRAYSQLAVAAESTREEPPTISPGDLLSHRNFYNPEFDAKLTDYVGWTRGVPGLSLFSPDEFKFHFAWWGFYDGMFDYLSPKWREALRAVPRTRQSSSDDIPGETTRFNDENKNPRHILGRRNRINELYLDYNKGRFFTRIGRQSIAWGEADAIVFMDVINNFDLTMGVPGVHPDASPPFIGRSITVNVSPFRCSKARSLPFGCQELGRCSVSLSVRRWTSPEPSARCQ